jgi:iduronate 2-sulfatase
MRSPLRRLLPLLAGLLLPLPAVQAAAPAPGSTRLPNVLFIIADDLNTLLGAYGDPQARTPHLDRLAARGVRFDRAYCTFPLCGPSRNSMLTGLYPNSSGIYGNSQIFRQTVPQQVSLPQAFRHQGWFAARLGKLYHYGVPNSIGTDGHDDPASWELELNPAGVDRLEEHPKIFSLTHGSFGGTLSWYASPKGDEHHTDGKLADAAEWVLERCASRRDRPFFLAVGFFRPHTPYVAPRPYFAAYPEAEMRVVTGVKEDQADLPPAALASYKREQDNLTDPLRRQALQAYYASISFMDAQVGRVLAALDRLGLADSTTLVFTSDHGYLTGEHGLWQKQSLFEPSARVPLLIVAPGVGRPGSVVRTPVSQVDLYPTLCELAGVKAPANLQGESLVPLLKDPAAPSRGWALTQVARGGRPAGAAAATAAKAEPGTAKVKGGARAAKKAVSGGEPGERFFGYSLRTARWRYTEWGDAGKHGAELYDHDRDPGELTNLADRPEHAAARRELAAKLAAAVRATYPASGEAPAVREGLWMPLLVP